MRPDVKIRVQKVHPNAIFEKAKEGDSCYDLVAVSREFVNGSDGHFVKYKLGIKTEIPEGWEGQLRPRSSISGVDMILCNGPGTIDSGFRGEWQARFRVIQPTAITNTSQEFEDLPEDLTFDAPIKLYEVGDRVCQVKISRVPTIDVECVSEDEELTTSDRGEGGHGSTGR